MAVGGNRLNRSRNVPTRANSRACLVTWVSILFLCITASILLLAMADDLSRLQSDLLKNRWLLQQVDELIKYQKGHSNLGDENSSLREMNASTKIASYYTPNSKNFIFTSCKDILQQFPNSSSGYYLVKLNTEYYTYIYCEMKLICGGIHGGWSRLAYLNMYKLGTQCPYGMKKLLNPSSCKQKIHGPGCTSIKYAIKPKPYTQICGKVNGIQYNTLDGFAKFSSIRPRDPTVDDNYVDGVILTYGNVGSRTHIWTFVAVLCHVNRSNEQKIPNFVDNHYSFDGGIRGTGPIYNGTLWDDHQCSFSHTNNGMWFYRKFNEDIYEGIEMRVCRDEASDSEDLFVQYVEIFVQ